MGGWEGAKHDGVKQNMGESPPPDLEKEEWRVRREGRIKNGIENEKNEEVSMFTYRA
jgi:hypothetical protein